MPQSRTRNATSSLSAFDEHQKRVTRRKTRVTAVAPEALARARAKAAMSKRPSVPKDTVAQSKKYKSAIDLWSVGCILAEIITR